MLAREEWSIPKVQPVAKPDVFSLESLIAWLEKQPADGVYCYLDNGGCLLHKYFTAMGVAKLDWVGGYNLHLNAGTAIPLTEAFEDISANLPHTFGAALIRARAALR
jgi:hypothetical protein